MQNKTYRYDELGTRVTDCCGAFSTFMDDGGGGETLCCKRCYSEVPDGQGDGTETAASLLAVLAEREVSDHPGHPRHVNFRLTIERTGTKIERTGTKIGGSR